MKKLRNFCDEMDDLLFGNEIFQSRTRGIGVIPADVAKQYGLVGANLRASGVDWDLRRDQTAADGVGQGRLEGLDPPRRRLLRPLLGAPAGDPRGHQDRRPAARRHAERARSWPRCRASSRCPRARRGSAPRTRSARWATTSSARATSARSGSRSARPASTTSRSCRGCCAACTCPTSSRSWPRLYFILGDIDR